jgi:hypothetical protein
MHGVVRKEALELLVELSRERLVVRQDERRLAELLDDVRCGERLAGTGGAEERLAILPREKAGRDLLDSHGLIAGGLEGADEIEVDGHDR